MVRAETVRTGAAIREAVMEQEAVTRAIETEQEAAAIREAETAEETAVIREIVTAREV